MTEVIYVDVIEKVIVIGNDYRKKITVICNW